MGGQGRSSAPHMPTAYLKRTSSHAHQHDEPEDPGPWPSHTYPPNPCAVGRMKMNHGDLAAAHLPNTQTGPHLMRALGHMNMKLGE